MRILELLMIIASKSGVLPISIKVDGIAYQIHPETDSYIRKEKKVYRELINDLSAKMPPRDWLQLKVELITDEEYEESIK